MQKIILLFAVLLFFTACTNQEKTNISSVEECEEDSIDCPIGLTNDPYPGSCGQYVDKDKNKICDYSE